MTEREVYLQQYESARVKMRAIVQLAQENPVIYSPWRMKEVLDHITGWDDAIIASMKSLLNGEIPATPAGHGQDVYNAETVSTREALSYELSQREWEAARAELLQLLRTLTDEQFKQPYTLPWGAEGTIELAVSIFAAHEATHAGEIEAIIRGGK